MFRTGFNTTATLTNSATASTTAVLGKAAFMFCLLFVVSACGGKRTVVTKDDSADYSSARALPPLRKAGGKPVSAQPEVANSQPTTPRPQPTQQVNPPQELPTGLPQSVAPQIADSEGLVDNSAQLESVALEANVDKASKRDRIKQASEISAKVVEKDKSARLVLDGPFEASWVYISNNLKGSDVTVHNRNEVAGRFSIGCSDMEVEESKTKSAGWSFFKKKGEELEYCALQLIGKRKTTEVSVLNRSGLEVEPDAAKAIFSRLLNN